MIYIFFAAFFFILISSCHRVDGQTFLYRFLEMGWSGDLFSLSFLYLLFFISSLVRIWSYYYMDNDSAFQRFNLIIMAFILAMVILIISSNLCTALIGWDGLGVTSFLLVVYYKKRNSLGSGMMTSLTNRLGDSFLLCRLGLFLRGPAVNILILYYYDIMYLIL